MTTETWGDFEVYLDELIGEGGMGKVYRGRQISIDRPVAIKVLNEELSQESEFIKRFRREGMVMGQLSDEHIVQVFGAGETEDRYYIAMELLEGKTLEELMEEAKEFSFAEICRVGSGVAKAMRAAWEHDIIHRDLKPDNIFLQKGTNVKVMDYGLARQEGTSLTTAGTVMGTYMYMSIEQLEGEELDVRSDIYSLGLILYQMITGFVFGSGQTATEIYKNRSEEDPKLPREIIPEIPKPLEDLIMKCLRKEKDRRFSNPSELVSRFQEIQSSDQFNLEQSGINRTVLDGDADTRTAHSSSLEKITSFITTKFSLNSRSGVFTTLIALAILVGAGALFWTNQFSLNQIPFVGIRETVEQGGVEKALSFPDKSVQENIRRARTAEENGKLKEAREIIRGVVTYLEQSESSTVDRSTVTDLRTRILTSIQERAIEERNWGRLENTSEVLLSLNDQKRHRVTRDFAQDMQSVQKQMDDENWDQALTELQKWEERDGGNENIAVAVKNLKNTVSSKKYNTLLYFPEKSFSENLSKVREVRANGNLESAEEILTKAKTYAEKTNADELQQVTSLLSSVRYDLHERKARSLEEDGNQEEALKQWKQAVEFKKTDEAQNRIQSLQTTIAKKNWEKALEEQNWEALEQASEQLLDTSETKNNLYERTEAFARDMKQVLRAQESKQWKTALKLLENWVGKSLPQELDNDLVTSRKKTIIDRRKQELNKLKNTVMSKFRGQNWSQILTLTQEFQNRAGILDRTLSRARQIAKMGERTPDGMVFFPGTKLFPDSPPEDRPFVGPFYMDRTEVTVQEYAQFLQAVKKNNVQCPYDQFEHLDESERSKLQQKDHTPSLWDVQKKRGPQYPVSGVDLYDAYCYAHWADKQLPTETEWEIAALFDPSRQKQQTYPWGSSFDASLIVRDEPVSVTDLPERGSSPTGVVGMAGNVGEWTHTRSGEASGNSSASVQYVVKGVPSTGDHQPDLSSNQNVHTVKYRSVFTVGFRCVSYPSNRLGQNFDSED